MTQNDKPAIILGLDYGIKKMGMALGNTLSEDARPFDILAMDNGQPDWDNLIGMVQAWQVDIIIIGLPLHMDGTESMLTKRASKFARRLAHSLAERHVSAKVYGYDERLTSHEARQLALDNGWIDNPNDPIDDISACLMVQSYLHEPDRAVYVGSYYDNPDKGKP